MPFRPLSFIPWAVVEWRLSQVALEAVSQLWGCVAGPWEQADLVVSWNPARGWLGRA